MSKRTRTILLGIGITLAALVLILIVAAIRIVQTEWFRSYVTGKIVAAVEEATGGRVEVGSFEFAWRHLQADVDNLVIHGEEPAGAAPFVLIPHARVNVRLFTSIHHILDITYAGIDRPQVNVVVLADGRSNIPSPKPTPSSGQPPLQSIVNAAIGHFDLNNAVIAFSDAQEELSFHADNFRAELYYSALPARYRGELSFQPLETKSGAGAPVAVTLVLPVEIEADQVSLNGATISTPQSSLHLDGTVENLRNPKLTAHLTGSLALADMKNLGGVPLDLTARDVPSAVTLDANATASSDAIQVTRLWLDAGQSNVEASGALLNPDGTGSLQFSVRAALGQVGRLINSPLPDGVVDLSGNAKLAGDYVNLSALHVKAFGAALSGDASLQNYSRFQFHGDLQNLTLQAAAQLAGQQRLPYSGTIGGTLAAAGDLKAAHALTAQANLSIKPGKSGVPISGHLEANYSQAADNLQVGDSYLALPHSRVNLSGDTGRQLNVDLTTSDLADFLAASPQTSVPLDLQGHPLHFNGTIAGGLTSGRITGQLRANGFKIEGRAFDTLALDASASQSGIAIQDAEVTRGIMRAQFSGKVGMSDWRLPPTSPLNVNANLTSGDLADVLAFAGQPLAGTSGPITAMAQVNGTIGNPLGSASVTALSGTLQGEPFDRIQAQVNLRDRLIDVPSVTLDRGSSHVSITAQLHHPADSLTTGQLSAHIDSNAIELAQVQTVQKQRPGVAGSVTITADATAELGKADFMLTSANGKLGANGLRFDGQNYGDLTVNATSKGQAVDYQLASNFAGSNIRVTGNTRLVRDYPTTLDADISKLALDRVLAAAQRTDIPAKGILSGTAHLSGTKSEPTGSADLTLTGANLYDEPIDSVRAKASYEARKAAIQEFQIVADGAQLGLTAEFDHPDNNLKSGSLQFHVTSSNVNLARIHNLQSKEPGLAGTAQISADGSARLQEGEPRVSVQTLKANVALNKITRQNRNLGDATLTADTQNNKINFVLASNLAGADIQAHGTAEPNGDYPVDAQLTFSKVAWARIQQLIGPQTADQPTFDASTEGQISIQGPAAKPEQMRGSLRLTNLELSPIAKLLPSGTANTAPTRIALKNQDPIVLTLNSGSISVDSLHLTGAQTDIQGRGSVSLKDRSINLRLNGNADVGVLQTLDRDISSSGNIAIAATARGTISKPALNGTLQLQNVSFNDTSFPNGISKANGTVNFNGNGASLQNLTAQSGGGKLNVTGFAVLGQSPRFGLKVNISGVRFEVQQGVSAVGNADLSVTGTQADSTVSGQATITRINYAPQTDLGSILTRATPSVQDLSTPSPLLDNMKLNVQVRTSDALAVQSALAQSVEGTANLTVRGTASRPSVLGRVTLTAGTLTFFGNSYTVDSGTIGFYNPVKIEPVLDVNLETNTKGVDVTLRVTGPIENLKLSYTSDPPLQFEEILGLLATGSTPTTDPTLLANNPPASQNVTQMGESAVLGSAVANPVASRLQRVFGITQLKIDPAFTNGSSTPDATLSLQQQVAKNITFTYVTEVNNANAETIRVEWTLNPEWTAAAMRDDNGIFSVNFYYKRQFR